MSIGVICNALGRSDDMCARLKHRGEESIVLQREDWMVNHSDMWLEIYGNWLIDCVIRRLGVYGTWKFSDRISNLIKYLVIWFVFY